MREGSLYRSLLLIENSGDKYGENK